jgi:hypothetical protein
MRRFLANNSLAILSLIAIKNSQRDSREGQGARVHQSSFCPGARGCLSPALERVPSQARVSRQAARKVQPFWLLFNSKLYI